MGADTWTVLSRYLFLNVIQSVPALFALNAADAILVLGGLGFLGLGLPEQLPSGDPTSPSPRCITHGHLVDSSVSWVGYDFNGSGTVFGGGKD